VAKDIWLNICMNPIFHGIQITDLVYGSPNTPQLDKMKKMGKALTALQQDSVTKQKFFNKLYPSNISPEVRRELTELVKRTTNISPADLEFATQAEKDHYGIWIKFLYNMGISISKPFLDKITDETDGLLYTLKYHYNRPRPFQLGYYHGIHVNPVIYSSANSPAFPSGHAMESRLFALILSEKYPFAADKIMNMGNKIAESRLNAGVHYPSDTEFSFEIAQWIFSKKCF
jgi:membrane-associated phospholipid phosphatase